MKIENDILIPELARLMAEGKEVRFTPSGVSMRPFIEGDKDCVILAPYTDTRKPKKGDAVLAKIRTADGRTSYVLHRLIKIQNDGTFVLQGDGNLQGEEYTNAANTYGFVVRVERPNGKRKCLTKGKLWLLLKPLRKWLLKIYRHTILLWFYNS